ncbi:MAG: type III secretion system chaperone, partial [Zoogloeaceae bacterium]|nr:type III secretion system chaperone [Zoogloeaceae bacterium]
MSAQAFVEALGQTLGLDLALSPAGDLAFALDGRGFLLQWRETSHSFVVYAEIGHLAGWRDGEVCRRLLSANFLLAETQGAALSYDGINNVVGLN